MTDALTIECSLHFRRHGKGAAKDLRAGEQPVRPTPRPGRLPRVCRLLALAHRFDHLLRTGQVETYAELARRGRVSRARVSQIMQLLLLSPAIQEQLLFLPPVQRGRASVRLADLLPIAATPDWAKQRRKWQTLRQRIACIGQVLPVRVIADEVIVYSTGLEAVARHRLVPGTQSGVRQLVKSHHPTDDPNQRIVLLRQRFAELGPIAVQFLDGLLAKQMQGKLQAQQLLALVAHYQREDVRAALERAVRFGAFSLAAMRRILAAQARPKRLLDELAQWHRDTLDPSLRQEPIGPRPTSDYQHLLSPEQTDETPSDQESPAPEGPSGRRCRLFKFDSSSASPGTGRRQGTVPAPG